MDRCADRTILQIQELIDLVHAQGCLLFVSLNALISDEVSSNTSITFE